MSPGLVSEGVALNAPLTLVGVLLGLIAIYSLEA
jgi:hypothetical protein